MKALLRATVITLACATFAPWASAEEMFDSAPTVTPAPTATTSDAGAASPLLKQPLPASRAPLRIPALKATAVTGGRTEPKVLTIIPGVTEIVRVSATMLTRVATPFREAIVLDSSEADIQTIGGNVFILPADNRPFGVFVSSKEPGSPTIALTLVPSDLPTQNIIVQFEAGARAWATGGRDDRRETESSAHSKKLTYIMRQVVQGRIPEGFTEAKQHGRRMTLGPVKVESRKRWSGSDLSVYQYRLTNTGVSTIEITETSFYKDGVKAVGFAPKVRLAAGEQTWAFVIEARATEGEM